MNAAALGALEHEELHVRRGERTGVHVAVAIHSTALGPALGGARLWRYGTPGDGIADALRLSEAMTLKAAAAGLDLGGGKCVMCLEEGAAPLDARAKRELMHDLGDLVESLGGRYVTAEDVGTSPEDMVSVAERTPYVVGLPPERGGRGDPSPLTARGVLAATRACVRHRRGGDSLAGVRVCIAGLGHVGLSLAELLAVEGAELVVTDIDGAKRTHAERLGARWIDPAGAASEPCDVFAPCALGGSIHQGNVRDLGAGIVCGSANNVLADESLAASLDTMGVLYAPDFIANAGGLIGVGSEWTGSGEGDTLTSVDGIGDALDRVFELSERTGTTTLEAARRIADARLRGRSAQLAAA